MGKITAPRTARFNRRRSEILETACRLINVHGLRGMTLTAVARELDLDTSSVTYYFRRKDELAAAAIERTLVWGEEMATAAAQEPDPVARVRRFVAAHVDLHRRQRDPAVAPLALLSDMRALDDDVRLPLDAIYARTLQTVRGFFEAGPSRAERDHAVYATVLLLNTIHWLPAWQDRYMAGDLDRVEARLFDLLSNGIAADRQMDWKSFALEEDQSSDTQEKFLHAATNLINRIGYQGASVERIAAELGVSTGSFYHHIDNKDDLVIACFIRSFRLVKRAGALSDDAGGSQGERLSQLIASLVAQQLFGESPMLRHSAYQALPVDLRQAMLSRTGQITRHIAGRFADAAADGSLRPMDPVIAGHVVMSALNGAAELRHWAAGRDEGQVVADFCRLLHRGIFAA